MQQSIQYLFYLGIAICTLAIVVIFGTNLYLKPSLPEINLVDESELQMPLKVYTKDKKLIGEFGEIKRRSVSFNEIPINIKNAFLAAEDDNFFNHQGISYTGLIRSFIRCLRPTGCEGGGGTITMQVVRGYLLTREQTITRKIKEIFLALELEGNLKKEEIFELYVNRIFLGNRSYGIQAAANTYFDKNLDELNISESATIAALAQLPSRVNPVKDKRRTQQRRNWILSRMLLLDYINKDQYDEAILDEIKIANDINLFDVDASYIAELARQDVIERYGLKAYKEGWSVYTTIDSYSQNATKDGMLEQLFLYDKRHGWRNPDNFQNLFSDSEIESLQKLDLKILFDNKYFNDMDLDDDDISNKINNVFNSYPHYKTHTKAIVLKVEEKKFIAINQNLELIESLWSNEYSWARNQESIDSFGSRPNNFEDLLAFGDFIYLKNDDGFFTLDQIPIVESSIVSINPKNGEVKAYHGGKNFNSSNFDRVRLSYPQTGSSFKPFIYASSLANGYNLSSLINDAPIAFEDENLESVWRPQNYTGKFYGPISLREALTKSVNIVSIKLLRELGLEKSQEYIENFGFPQSRLPNDLSLALGSGNFSPAEMVRAFSVIASDGYIPDMHYIHEIKDRDGNLIFSHNESLTKLSTQSINAFPWLDTIEMNVKSPYYLLKPLNKKDKVIDERISFLIKDTLEGFLKNGVAGRKSAFLERDDIGGKTGTTNDSVSTWFSGFHQDLVTTVWVGTDDFTSLGQNEYGSTIALPIWLYYMDKVMNTLEVSNKNIPEDISFVKVNKLTGKVDADAGDDDAYFELFLKENID